jgi:predicted nuclease with TOPRIM domain
MSSEAALLSLSATISGLQGQIDDLKQDKRDLRSDKESLKAEVADLKEQLRVASAEAARLKDDLQITNSRVEEWKKLCELATVAQTQKAPDVVSHQATSFQVRHRPQDFHSDPMSTHRQPPTLDPRLSSLNSSPKHPR